VKDVLEIKNISYGEFPEIFSLNPRFKPNSKKLKVIIDVRVPQAQKDRDLSPIIMKLVKLLPSLQRHQCGEHLFGKPKPSPEDSRHSERLEKATQVAHLMEHVIIDLQSRITGMNSCSGITCGYKEPRYRFDIFVECEDKKVGTFSAFFAVDLLKRLLTNKRLTGRYQALIDLVGYLYRNKSIQSRATLESMASRISSDLGLRKGFVTCLLRKLREFGFLDFAQGLAS